ncbi:hypothetical protein TNCV_3827871 [Trichonephila clavipes]|nr:hypothetical protein TNCV_3827871 [Trichonephila clavipes]
MGTESNHTTGTKDRKSRLVGEDCDSIYWLSGDVRARRGEWSNKCENLKLRDRVEETCKRAAVVETPQPTLNEGAEVRQQTSPDVQISSIFVSNRSFST